MTITTALSALQLKQIDRDPNRTQKAALHQMPNGAGCFKVINSLTTQETKDCPVKYLNIQHFSGEKRSIVRMTKILKDKQNGFKNIPQPHELKKKYSNMTI